MVIIKSRRVGTTTSITTTKKLRTVTDRCSTRGETVWGEGFKEGEEELVDEGARTEYFNFLRGCAAAVQNRSRREQFTRTVWLACLLGVDRGRSRGVSLDGRTPDFHPLSGSGATPSAPTSPPPSLLPLHHHSDCE